ncbi:iron ABC transporter permease [Brachybacterium sp. HMSC06H03]|uniref:FecCD family ABC transporter permease n=1 Tax=Brachybacterium sp. HMSC06H03 TaxID=1581127 RepID=UPI0009F5A75C|nr:iron ABC transporter permease [Brachybacterium sp. HMSC06H03]
MVTDVVPPQRLRAAPHRAVPRGRALLTLCLAGLVPAAVLAATSLGPSATGPVDTLVILLEPTRPMLEAVGISPPVPSAATASLVWSIRLPRVLLALVVGAGLGAAGLVMQAVFRNPLADPGVTGVSSGAAMVAVILIVTGLATPLTLPLGAFLGALAAVFVVQLVAGLRGGGGGTLLLVGIAMNSLLGAVISAAIANAPRSDDAQAAMFWLNGDLTGATWTDVAVAALPGLVGIVVLLGTAGELNLFLLGEDQAASTGMRTARTRQVLLALSAVVIAAGVCVTGVIGFVGLVVPHLARLLLGPDHRVLLPVSVLVGGVFLVLADVVARNLFDPVTLQTGIVTALVGAPVLLALVCRRGGR